MSKLYLNIDSDTVVNPFLKRLCDQKYFSKEMLYPMVDMYRNIGVTDIVLNIFCQISATRSEIWTDILDKYTRNEENEIQVNYKDDYGFANKLCNRLNVDYFKVWIDRCKHSGMNPWISIRMNDCHNPFDKTSNIRSDFHFVAEKNNWILGDDYGYFRICLNYKVKEVRDAMLSYIREQLFKYDIYGLELDFLREVKCFRYFTEDMDECRSIMTGFISDVRRTVTEAEYVHGHKIKILVRLPRDIKQCLMLGFDPEAWAVKNLVDIISPAPRFNSNDSSIPVSEWKEKACGREVTVGIETLLSFNKNIAVASAEICTGLAASFLASGSDGIYLYNFFCDPDDIVKPQIHPYTRNIKTIGAVSDFEKIYNYPMRIALIDQEDNYIPGVKNSHLPILVCNDSKSINIITGKIPEDKTVSLIIGYKKNLPCVMFNGVLCDLFREVDLTYIPGIGQQPDNYIDKEAVCIRFEIKPEAVREFAQTVSFFSDADSEIVWVEIDVI